MPINSGDRDNCSVSKLLEFLEGTLPEADQYTLEFHLNGCKICQEAIQRLAADKEFWCTATLALEDSTYDSDADAQLRGWLDPTETPNALGHIGHYLVHRVVGRGGMGVVLSATDQELGRSVAIKTLANPINTVADEKRRLLREARASANVRHAHVVPIHSVETWRDVPFIVMPLIEDGTLEAYAADHRFSLDEVLGIASQMASALVALHQANIVHRDIKPSNILLSHGIKHCLLSDFGLARQHGDVNVTQSDVLLGTPHFMSPEQALGKKVDFRSDLFSLGSVLYWLGTGRRPFLGASNYEILHSLVHHSPDYRLLEQRGYPKYFIALLEKLLAKEPDKRWASAEQFLAMAQSAIHHRHSSASTNLPKELETHRRRTDRLRGIALVVMVAIPFLLAAWVIFFGSRPIGDPDTKTASLAQQKQPIALKRLGPDETREMLHDLSLGRRQEYWLKQLDSFAIDEVPAKAIDELLKLESAPDPVIRELAMSILRKDPFLETTPASIDQPRQDPTPSGGTVNPFVEISPFEEIGKLQEGSPFIEVSGGAQER
jgi:hypothetical protein